MSANASAEAHSRGLELLEEWPKLRQDRLSKGEVVILPPNLKQVTFSTYSNARSYKCCSSYRRSMSYSSADCKLFRAEVAREGLRIQRLISSCPPSKSRNVIHHLFDLNVLSMDELIGIEHLISRNALAQLVHERRAHAARVLKAQKEMQDLASTAIMSSSRSIEKARLRAKFAA